MKILMIGLGSIGQRHLRNIRHLCGDSAEFIAYRTRRLKTTLTDDLKIREGVDLEEEYNIRAYTDLNEALAQKPQLAFITNVTSAHMEAALACARAGVHMLIEKPLSHDAEGVSELARLAEDKQLKIFMGFQNRYHPCVQKLKETLKSGELGRLRYVSCEFSERVTTMHRYEDYRDTYMARQSLGGGPVLNLQMHDLDILNYLLGRPKRVQAQLNCKSGLDIDVEESAQAIFLFPGELPVYTHTDFLQYPPVHRFSFVGERGRAEADLNKVSFVKYTGDGATQEWSDPGFVRNDMFMQELKDLLACIENNSAPAIPLAAGMDSLAMALAEKRSSEYEKTVEVEYYG